MSFRHVLTGILSLAFGLLFPAYGSFQAIESKRSNDDTQWLVYWLLYSLVQAFEKFAYPVLQWVPLYGEVRVAVLMWLVLPQTKGATWLYEAIVGPAFKFVLREASKVPAIQKLIQQTDAAMGQASSAPSGGANFGGSAPSGGANFGGSAPSGGANFGNSAPRGGSGY